MIPDRGRRWRAVHHVVGSLVVAGWLGTTLSTCWPQASESFDPSRALPPARGATERSFGIYYQDTKIGFAQNQRIPLDDGGARFLDRAYWRFRAQGMVQRLATESEVEVDAHWALRRFKARIDAGVARLGVQGVVHGNSLDVEVQTGGRVEKESFDLPGPVIVPAVIRAFVAARDPEPGTNLQLQVYNPLFRDLETIDVLVEERTEQGWRISEIFRSALKTDAWIDRDGMTRREDSAIGFSMRAEPRDEALRLSDDSESVPDLILAVAAPATGAVPDSPATVTKLKVRLQGIDSSSFPLLQGQSQQRLDDILTVSRETWPAQVSYTLPYVVLAQGADAADPSTPPAWDRPELALLPETLLQARDPAVVAKAREILDGTVNPAEAAMRLSTWVHEHVRKVNSAGVPSAIDVLNSMQGDCNEHTVLFTALARAVGLPARMAAGVVLVDLHGEGAAFYYHAWPEVWLDGWRALDPTLGQIPADATHLRFVVGGLDQQVDILRLIGSLRVEILETEGGPSPAQESTP
ncbi:MAG: transglutaminase-like domain-containing protein [Pseudomonadota bacterium]